ncbi:MAG: glycosyltransferase family 9 protein, partial [Thermodesulfobacteriota bacterium]
MDLAGKRIGNILIRGTNWVGDAVLTFPALAAVRKAFSSARITVLARPWVAPLYAEHPAVDRTMVLDKGGLHRGVRGLFRLAGQVRREGFDLAVLFQNAFEAALIAWLARIPLRLGYDTDARGLLLRPAVGLRPEDKTVHETEYYLRMLERAGIEAPRTRPVFRPSAESAGRADQRLR